MSVSLGRSRSPEQSKDGRTLANSKSALKHIKTSENRRLRNRGVKSTARTFVRQARAAIGSGAEEASVSLTAAISALDKAAQKGVIHRNNAARRKSRLIKLLRQQEAPAKRSTRKSAKSAG